MLEVNNTLPILNMIVACANGTAVVIEEQKQSI